MSEEYTRFFYASDNADAYDRVVYNPNSYDSFISRQQIAWLRDFVSAEFGNRPPIHHDFACGTGRIVEALSGHVLESHGYDTSSSMLERARQKSPSARFHLIGQDQSAEVPPGAIEGKVLVTMFRLLLNASPQARASGLAFAAQVLRAAADTGVLILNNHGNKWSLRQLASLRRYRKDAWFHALSSGEVQRLAKAYGLEIVNAQGFGVTPRSLHNHRLTRRMAERMDMWAQRVPWLTCVSIDVVYVIRARPQ